MGTCHAFSGSLRSKLLRKSVIVVALLWHTVGTYAKLEGVMPQDQGRSDNGPNLVNCWSCEPPYCDEIGKCFGVVLCWKTRTIDRNGFERVARGCIMEDSKIAHFMCTAHAKSAAYSLECCSDRDYCNEGDFPELPRPPSHEEDLEPKSESDTPFLVAGLLCAFGIFIVIIYVTVSSS